LIGLLLLGTLAWGLQIRADMRAHQARTARALRRRWSADAPAPTPRWPAPPADDELLRTLLEE
jgi:hypothetical protein